MFASSQRRPNYNNNNDIEGKDNFMYVKDNFIVNYKAFVGVIIVVCVCRRGRVFCGFDHVKGIETSNVMGSIGYYSALFYNVQSVGRNVGILETVVQ